MGFHEISFPQGDEWGTEGGPGFATDIVATESGAEERIARWSSPRRQYDVAWSVKSYEDLAELRRFYHARLGAANGFRYKDWLDYTSHPDNLAPSNTDQIIGDGDGVATVFQLVKRYVSGSEVRTRNIRKPVAGSVTIAFDGVNQTSGWTVNTTTGVITFTSPPGAAVNITAGFEFDTPVRFGDDTDRLLTTTLQDFSSGSAKVTLVEILDEVENPEEYYYGGSTTLDPLSANYTLSVANGRAIAAKPSSSGLKLILPDPTGLPPGGPYFFIFNTSPTHSLAVDYPSGTTLATVSTSTGVTVILTLDSLGNEEWYVI